MFRIFTFLFSVLIVALIAVAFIRGWVRLSVFDKENADETGAAVTINKTKIKEDVNAVKDKVHIPAKPADGKQGTTVHGMVKEIGASGLILTTDSDKSLELNVALETEVRIGNEKGTLKDLHQGDPVTATYVTVENRRVATALRKE
jgi:hypothetical protein